MMVREGGGKVLYDIVWPVGSPFVSGDKCHLRHIPTNMYLTVNQDHKVWQQLHVVIHYNTIIPLISVTNKLAAMLLLHILSIILFLFLN